MSGGLSVAICSIPLHHLPPHTYTTPTSGQQLIILITINQIIHFSQGQLLADNLFIRPPASYTARPLPGDSISRGDGGGEWAAIIISNQIMAGIQWLHEG